MKQKHWKTLLTITGAALLCAATWLAAPTGFAAFTTQGQDHAGKNCERVDSPGSSTFGKCEDVCNGKEVTRDATNNRWVCQGRRVGSPNTTRPPKGNGGVLGQTPNPSPKTPPTGGGKAGRVQQD